MTELTILQGLRRQQAALAQFGSFAFEEDDLDKILTEAARVCAECLRVPFAKICRYRAEQSDLLVVAGYGWRDHVVGYVVSKADESSTQGRAFVSGEPVILRDIAKNNSYSLPRFYATHGIVSTVDVLIKGKAGPWGVLEADSQDRGAFNEHDIIFLTGFANVLAEAVAMAGRTATMRDAVEKMKLLVAEKGELLAERHSREIRLHELQTELLHVSRLNAMGQMTAAIAHELNQPLAAIANYVSAAKLTLDAPSPDSTTLARVREMIDKAQRQTGRAGSIIKNLRDIVEKRESRRHEEDLTIVVKDSLGLVLFGAIDAEISVELELDATTPAVLIDKIQIQQILVNLIRNSIEAMLDTEERRLTLTTGPGEAGFADVTVRDTGPGLPHNIAQHLFQPFNTSKGGGMGLGLMICQTLAEANGGRIWRIEDQPKGTGFRLSVPLALSEAMADDIPAV